MCRYGSRGSCESPSCMVGVTLNTHPFSFYFVFFTFGQSTALSYCAHKFESTNPPKPFCLLGGKLSVIFCWYRGIDLLDSYAERLLPMKRTIVVGLIFVFVACTPSPPESPEGLAVASSTAESGNQTRPQTPISLTPETPPNSLDETPPPMKSPISGGPALNHTELLDRLL